MPPPPCKVVKTAALGWAQGLTQERVAVTILQGQRVPTDSR